MPTPTGFRLQCFVTGMTFHKYKEVQDELITDPEREVEPGLFLLQDHANEYDPNAVRVMWQSVGSPSMVQIGFIPKEFSKQVKEALVTFSVHEHSIVAHERGSSYKNRLLISIHCWTPDEDEEAGRGLDADGKLI